MDSTKTERLGQTQGEKNQAMKPKRRMNFIHCPQDEHKEPEEDSTESSLSGPSVKGEKCSVGEHVNSRIGKPLEERKSIDSPNWSSGKVESGLKGGQIATPSDEHKPIAEESSGLSINLSGPSGVVDKSNMAGQVYGGMGNNYTTNNFFFNINPATDASDAMSRLYKEDFGNTNNDVKDHRVEEINEEAVKHCLGKRRPSQKEISLTTGTNVKEQKSILIEVNDDTTRITYKQTAQPDPGPIEGECHLGKGARYSTGPVEKQTTGLNDEDENLPVDEVDGFETAIDLKNQLKISTTSENEFHLRERSSIKCVNQHHHESTCRSDGQGNAIGERPEHRGNTIEEWPEGQGITIGERPDHWDIIRSLEEWPDGQGKTIKERPRRQGNTMAGRSEELDNRPQMQDTSKWAPNFINMSIETFIVFSVVVMMMMMMMMMMVIGLHNRTQTQDTSLKGPNDSMSNLRKQRGKGYTDFDKMLERLSKLSHYIQFSVEDIFKQLVTLAKEMSKKAMRDVSDFIFDTYHAIQPEETTASSDPPVREEPTSMTIFYNLEADLENVDCSFIKDHDFPRIIAIAEWDPRQLKHIARKLHRLLRGDGDDGECDGDWVVC